MNSQRKQKNSIPLTVHTQAYDCAIRLTACHVILGRLCIVQITWRETELFGPVIYLGLITGKKFERAYNQYVKILVKEFRPISILLGFFFW